MEWLDVLKAQQTDFIARLKSNYLLHCKEEGRHSELTVISGERLNQLRDFCWEMSEKYKRTSPVRQVFINNMKGKLAEEVVKLRLGNLVTAVDYETKIGGDGKIDFTLTSVPEIGMQVKSRHGDIDTVTWSISKEEIEKNAVVVCVLIQEEVSEAQLVYNLILAGFLPTNMINLTNGKAALRIDELLYPGSLRGYLENLPCDEYIRIGNDFCYRGEYQVAISYYEQAISFKPNFAHAYINRGISYYYLGDYDKAIQDGTQAINIEPNSANAYIYCGNLYYYLRDYDKAIQYYRQAINIEPNSADSYYNVGLAYSNIKNTFLANTNFDQAANLYQKQGNIHGFQNTINEKNKLNYSVS